MTAIKCVNRPTVFPGHYVLLRIVSPCFYPWTPKKQKKMKVLIPRNMGVITVITPQKSGFHVGSHWEKDSTSSLWLRGRGIRTADFRDWITTFFFENLG